MDHRPHGGLPWIRRSVRSRTRRGGRTPRRRASPRPRSGHASGADRYRVPERLAPRRPRADPRGGQAIAPLVRPGEHRSSGSGSLGVEVEIPPPTDELRVRAMAHLMYRTLRNSGLRWALWRPGALDAVPTAVQQVSEASGTAWRNPLTPSTWTALGLASLSLLMLALVVPTGLGGGLTVTGLAALAVFRVAPITERWLPSTDRVRETAS